MLDNKSAIRLEDYNERKAEIVSRLNDYDSKDLLNICHDANCYDGSFDFVDCFEADEVENYIDTSDAYSFMCRIVFGNIESLGRYDMLRVNAYGNLESVNEWQLEKECEDCIDEIADWLMDNYDATNSLYSDDEELFEAWWEIDHDQYDWDEDEEE